jgi:hypothetical protein
VGAGTVTRVGRVAGMFLRDGLGRGVLTLQRVLGGLLLPGRRLGLQILAIVLTEGLGLMLGLAGLLRGLVVSSNSFSFRLLGGEIVLAFNAMMM